MNQYIGADKVSQKTVDDVLRLHNDGKSPNAISGILKTSTDKVRLILSDLSIKPNEREPSEEISAHEATIRRRAIERHQSLIREREYELC